MSLFSLLIIPVQSRIRMEVAHYLQIHTWGQQGRSSEAAIIPCLHPASSSSGKSSEERETAEEVTHPQKGHQLLKWGSGKGQNDSETEPRPLGGKFKTNSSSGG